MMTVEGNANSNRAIQWQTIFLSNIYFTCVVVIVIPLLLRVYATYTDIVPLCYGTRLPRSPMSIKAWRRLYDADEVLMEWRSKSDIDGTTKADHDEGITTMRCRFFNNDNGITNTMTMTIWGHWYDCMPTMAWRRRFDTKCMIASMRRWQIDDNGMPMVTLLWLNDNSMITIVWWTRNDQWIDEGGMTIAWRYWRGDDGMTTTVQRWHDESDVEVTMMTMKRLRWHADNSMMTTQWWWWH